MNTEATIRTLAVWQPRTSRPLTEEDARQITENVTGFFRVLQKWSRAEKAPSAEGEKTATESSGMTFPEARELSSRFAADHSAPGTPLSCGQSRG